MKKFPKPTVLIPDNDGHAPDSFRELLMLWEDGGLVELKRDVNCRYITFLYGQERVILYDWDLIDHRVFWEKHTAIIFGNETTKVGSPWIFWARHPKRLHLTTPVEWRDRVYRKSVFIGTRIGRQAKYRTEQGWSEVIDDFYLGQSGTRRFDQEAYLNHVSKFSFGLCLRGLGPKCNREVELLRLGVIPLITNGVSLKYQPSLFENVHYIKAETPDSLVEKINSFSDSELREISSNCIEYYNNYLSPAGSFHVTIELMNSLLKTKSKGYFWTDPYKYLFKHIGHSVTNFILHNCKVYGMYRFFFVNGILKFFKPNIQSDHLASRYKKS